jgi:hypothetical protein
VCASIPAQVEELPEGLQYNPNMYRIRPSSGHDDEAQHAQQHGAGAGPATPSPSPEATPPGGGTPTTEGLGGAGGGIRFTDKDEHMYFWFPLLAGLSELTFDPRPDIRNSSMEVCGHGGGAGVCVCARVCGRARVWYGWEGDSNANPTLTLSLSLCLSLP